MESSHLQKKKKGEKKSLLKEEKDYCLQFDGKRLVKQEYQVVCVKSATRDIRPGVARCKSGSSKDIYDALEKVIDEYDAWSSSEWKGVRHASIHCITCSWKKTN